MFLRRGLRMWQSGWACQRLPCEYLLGLFSSSVAAEPLDLGVGRGPNSNESSDVGCGCLLAHHRDQSLSDQISTRTAESKELRQRSEGAESCDAQKPCGLEKEAAQTQKETAQNPRASTETGCKGRCVDWGPAICWQTKHWPHGLPMWSAPGRSGALRAGGRRRRGHDIWGRLARSGRLTEAVGGFGEICRRECC